MALVRISTARLVYSTTALFLALAIMLSCTSSFCQAGNCGGKPCGPPPPLELKLPCFEPRQQRRCSAAKCPRVCAENGIKGCKDAYCERKVIPYKCCCPHYYVV
ncbi:unnamed protein product [Urochloa decumbens]|uniref:Uncharacterized protein n=1 Tax=Urochloa decumbens TaxID=240449 RepID=A0ABC9AY90_9POAL